MSLKTLLCVARSHNCRCLGSRRWKSTPRNYVPGEKRNSEENSEQISEQNTEQNQRNEEGKKEEPCLPPEPTFCCMSGCANCVWIKYAQELAQMFDDGDVIAKKKISEKVCDPNLRAYLFKQLGLKEDDNK